MLIEKTQNQHLHNTISHAKQYTFTKIAHV